MARKIAPIILVSFAVSGLILSLYRDLLRYSEEPVVSLERQAGQAALGPTGRASALCSSVDGYPAEATSQAGPASGRWQMQHSEAAQSPSPVMLFEGDSFPDTGGSEPQGLMVFRDGGMLVSWLPVNRNPSSSPPAKRVLATGQSPADLSGWHGFGSSIVSPAGGSSQDNVNSADTQYGKTTNRKEID